MENNYSTPEARERYKEMFSRYGFPALTRWVEIETKTTTTELQPLTKEEEIELLRERINQLTKQV